jgi:hypothetical protein
MVVLLNCNAHSHSVVHTRAVLKNFSWEMKNAVFWDVTSCGSCKNRYYSETSVLKEPKGVTPQKTEFYVVTAVKTPNVTSAENCLTTLFTA